MGKRPLRLPEPSGLLLLPQYHFRPVNTKIFTLGACRKFLSVGSSVTAQYPMSYLGPACRDFAAEHNFRCRASVAKFSMHVDNLILCVWTVLSCLFFSSSGFASVSLAWYTNPHHRHHQHHQHHHCRRRCGHCNHQQQLQHRRPTSALTSRSADLQ